ncbi:helix-turn-helix domain-containing protein [Amphibacillus cookii]|uniref:helix-turn-helix domain-containing protein n=1 Tax=Amphibacillus cookii TaxID=767787 RepID=UPI001958634F|nr:helix-turn-helix domain-containing protein [Amphibacillus cookii]MBM7541569.1 YesN/AraC family two-component response regulator [Amphibacillus cookii]
MRKRLNHIRLQLLNAHSIKDAYYKKSIVVLLLILCIPSLLIGATIYFFGARHLKDEMIATHEEQIINQVDYIDSQMQSLEVNLNYWSHEHLFTDQLDHINFQDQYQHAREITDSLFSKQNGNSLIERISLFINADRPIVFNPQFRWVNEDQLANYQHFLLSQDSFFWDRHLLKEESDHHLFPLVLVKNMPAFNEERDHHSASFIVELNRETVMQMVDGLSLSSDGFSFLIDQETGMMISSNEKSAAFFDEVVINQGIENGSFTTTWSEIDYSVTSGTINRVNADWIYMSVVPISFITEPINQLSQTIIVISLVGLFLSFMIANVTFRSIYRPIDKLLAVIKGNPLSKNDGFDLIESNWHQLNQEKNILEKRVDRLNNKLISNFFFQLIEGFLDHQTERELSARLAQYHVRLTEKKIRYLDVETINKKQQQLMIHLIERCFSCSLYVIPFNDRFVGIIFVFDDTQILEQQLNVIEENVRSSGKHELTVMYLSQTVPDLRGLISVVEQIRQKKYTKPEHDQTLLIRMPETFEATQIQGDLYPFHIEQRLIEAMDLGDQTKINALIDQFIAVLCERDERAIQYSFIQLYSAVQLQMLKEGFYPFELFEGKNILKALIHSYDIECLKATLINQVITPYVKAIKDKVMTKQDVVVKKALDYIHSHYMYDISLDQCANQCGINTYTLSKWFKQGKGINFIDYLTLYRIEIAKQLLVETSMKIQEISSAVGYRHSYFNRIFKKHTTMTPGQFRQSDQDVSAIELFHL